MRCNSRARVSPQRILRRQWFRIEYIEKSPADRPLIKRTQQVRRVDNRTTRQVDHRGTAREEPQTVSVQQTASCAGKRQQDNYYRGS